MDDMTLGQKVKEARIAKQMTQKELAGSFITRNMLSQIENDNATPSIKTIEYIASVLNKPISFFMNDDYSTQVSTIQELLTYFKDKNYLECIKKIELFFQKESKSPNSDLIDDIYINCCMKASIIYKNTGDFEKAKEVLNKVLAFKETTAFNSDILLYNIYSQLAEVTGYLTEVDMCKYYDHKTLEIINKMHFSRLIQNIHISFLEGKYSDVINSITALDFEKLNSQDIGRCYMLIGFSHFNREEFNLAITFLEKAATYFIHNPSNSILISIYEELSKCYYNLEDYKKAYQFLELSKKKS